MELYEQLAEWKFTQGYLSAVMRGQGGDFMAEGSENCMVDGEGLIRCFRGPRLLEDLVGARQFFNVDQVYAGLGTVAVNGVGSVFKVRDLLQYIGTGQVAFNGVTLPGIVASSILSFVAKTGDTYAIGPDTGPFQAGEAQPSAPSVTPKDSPSAGKAPMSGAIVLYIWRVSKITGQISLASLPSNIVVLNAQTAICQFPEADANGQTHFGIGGPKLGFAELGVGYQIPISLGGEVAEADLAYTRGTGAATIVDGTNIVDAAGANLTGADVGRRWSVGAYDSWITQINSPTEAVMNDNNTSGGDITAAGTITHAVDGITRAVEVSYSNGALLAALVPNKAFPPVPGQFAGVMNDTAWLDANGIIYIGDPGYNGSFPPSNACFANEDAVTYLQIADNVTARFGKKSVGYLYYVGGTPSIEYQTVLPNQGIKYPQNVALGYGGRLLAWFGKPTVVGDDLEPDFGYARDVMPDFKGWNEQQTADMPIVPGYDGVGQYEVWCLGQKVMARHAPTGQWCSPISLVGKTQGDVVSAVTEDHVLYLSCINGADLETYSFDTGTGAVMKVVTSDQSRLNFSCDITQIMAEGRADNTANPVKIDVIKDFDTIVPDYKLDADRTPARVGSQVFAVREPNVIGCEQHALQITITGVGGTVDARGLPVEAGLNRIVTMGATSEVLVR